MKFSMKLRRIMKVFLEIRVRVRGVRVVCGYFLQNHMFMRLSWDFVTGSNAEDSVAAFLEELFGV